MRNWIAGSLLFPLLGACIVWQPGAWAACERGGAVGPPALRVDGHYLSAAGQPFSWVGDTAWYGVTLNPNEMDDYLDDRQRRGFNVIQGPILIDASPPVPIAAEDPMALRPDAAGNRPFRSVRPLVPDENYWQSVDCFVNKATARGLYLVLPLMWGQTVDGLFTTSEQRRAYARFVVTRYAGYRNVMWLVTGEWNKIAWRNAPRDRTTPTQAEIAMIEEVAQVVEANKARDQLVTMHPDGHLSSSDQWHQRDWLDFNMIQSYDSQRQNLDDVARDWRRSPIKPTLQAELCYENSGNCGPGAWHPRMSAYIAAFSGSVGFTYGHGDVWSFGQSGNSDWRSALPAEGADDIARHFRELLQTYHTAQRIPDQSVLVSGAGNIDADNYVAVTRDRGGDYLLAYSSNGGSFQLDTRVIRSERIRARWFNPRQGRYQWIGGLSKSGRQQFDPPGAPGPDNDAVLVLDVPPWLNR